MYMYMYIIALFYPTGLKLKLKFIRSKMMVNCVQLVIIIPWHLGKKIEVNLCKKKNKQTNNQKDRYRKGCDGRKFRAHSLRDKCVQLPLKH